MLPKFWQNVKTISRGFCQWITTRNLPPSTSHKEFESMFMWIGRYFSSSAWSSCLGQKDWERLWHLLYPLSSQWSTMKIPLMYMCSFCFEALSTSKFLRKGSSEEFLFSHTGVIGVFSRQRNLNSYGFPLSRVSWERWWRCRRFSREDGGCMH